VHVGSAYQYGVLVGEFQIVKGGCAMDSLIWQTIDQQQQPTGPAQGLVSMLRTDRAKIPGGWLVRTLVLHREQTTPPGGVTDIETSVGSGVTFVPDPTHAWR
jgi:hypothetical protein